jgi:hypothetical protein
MLHAAENRGDRCGISNLNVDLRGLELRSLDLLEGESQIDLLLSKPFGTTFIYITGGIRIGTIRVTSRLGFTLR